MAGRLTADKFWTFRAGLTLGSFLSGVYHASVRVDAILWEDMSDEIMEFVGRLDEHADAFHRVGDRLNKLQEARLVTDPPDFDGPW